VDLGINLPPRLDRRKVLTLQGLRNNAESPFAVNAALRMADRGLARVAGMNRNRNTVEPTFFLQRHGDC
jgi:hypothetical protein